MGWVIHFFENDAKPWIKAICTLFCLLYRVLPQGPMAMEKLKKKICVCIGSTGTRKFGIALPFTERITHVFPTPRIFCEQLESRFNVPCFIVHFKGMKEIYSLIKHFQNYERISALSVISNYFKNQFWLHCYFFSRVFS